MEGHPVGRVREGIDTTEPNTFTAAMPRSTEVQDADRSTFDPLATPFEERYFTKKKASRSGHPISKEAEVVARNMNQSHMLAFAI